MAKKILCIDSDIETQDRVSEYLSNQGYIVTKQYKGKNVVDAIEKASPNLIILAVELPDVNGYVICKMIKTHPKLKNVPLILTSSEATPEDFEKHSNLKSRADKYLLKPFDNEELSIKIQNLLEERVEKSEVEIDVEVEKEPDEGRLDEQTKIKKKVPPRPAVSEEIQKELKKVREEALSLSREKTELESKLSQERARGKELEEKLSETKKVLNEKLHETTKNLEEVRQERDEFKVRHKRMSDEFEHLRSEQRSSRGEREKYLEEMNNLKKGSETLLESLKEAQGLNERNNEELEDARHKIEYLQQGDHVAEDMEAKILAMDEEIKEKEKTLEDALSRCKNLEESLSLEKEEHAAFQMEMEKKLSSLQENIHKMEEEVEAGEALTSRILVLEEEALESSKYSQDLQEKIDAAIKERDEFRLQCENLVEQHQKNLEQMDADFEREKGALMQNLSSLEEKLSNQENNNRTLTESQEALSREKETLDQDHKALQTEFSVLKETLKEKEGTLLQIADAREKDMAYMKEELSKKEGELASLKESLANKEQDLAQVSASTDALRTEKDMLAEETRALKEQVLTMENGLLEMGPLNERIKALEKSLEEAVRQRDEYYQHSLRIYEDAERLRKELEAAYSAAPQSAPPPSSPIPSVSSAPLPEPPPFEESFEALETSLEDLDK